MIVVCSKSSLKRLFGATLVPPRTSKHSTWQDIRRPVMECINIRPDGVMEATNTHVLIQEPCAFPVGAPDRPVLVPRDAVKRLAKGAGKQLTIDVPDVHDVDGATFPGTDRIVPLDFTATLTGCAGEFQAALEAIPGTPCPETNHGYVYLRHDAGTVTIENDDGACSDVRCYPAGANFVARVDRDYLALVLGNIPPAADIRLSFQTGSRTYDWVTGVTRYEVDDPVATKSIMLTRYGHPGIAVFMPMGRL